MQLATAGSTKSIRMATVTVDLFQGQLFQNEHPISRSQADASALVFFIGEYFDQSLSNCLILFIYAARKLINHLIAEKMLVYRHGSSFHTVLA
jgi:hypothetical protein